MAKQHVIVGCQRVGLVQFKGLTADHHVLDAVFARNARKHAVLVLFSRGRDARVNLVSQTGDLQEAAVFARHSARAPFQRVQHLLTRHADDAHGVAEGMDAVNVVERNVARFNLLAAAVDKRNVRVGQRAVRIGAQVAQIRFGVADDADRRAFRRHRDGVIDVERHLRGCNDGLTDFVELGDLRRHRVRRVARQIQQLRRGNVHRPSVQTRRQLAILGNAQIADGGQLRAASRAQHRLAFSILNFVAGHRLVRVAVKERINTRGMRDDFGAHVGRAAFLNAHMPHGNDVRCAFRARRIHRGLHRRVELIARFILHEAVDEVAFLVLEVDGRGGGNRVRGSHADKSDFHAVKFLDDVGRENQRIAAGEVRGDVGEIRLLGQFEEVLHAVIKFMIAGDGDVVADRVHQLNDGASLGQCADGFALNRVAIIDKHHMVVCLQAVAHIRHTRVAPALVNAAVDVTGKEHHNVLGQRGGCVFRESSAAQQHGEHQQNRKKLLHSVFLLIVLSRQTSLSLSSL